MAKKRRLRVSEQIRQHIAGCGLSRYQIWKATGVDQATLSRFMSGERGISVDALDSLGEFLGFEIVMRKPTKETQP